MALTWVRETSMKDYSKRALMAFVETSINKGWVNLNTGGGVRTACRQILEQVADDEDVRGVNVPEAVRLFANRNPGKLSGDSLKVYQSRVQGMIDSFTSFVDDPVAYKPTAKPSVPRSRKAEPRNGQSDVTRTEAQASASSSGPAPSSHQPVVRAMATETSLTLPFNLRPDFLAQVTVPRDLTKDEAKRLSTFIDALAIDVPVQR